MTHTQFDIAGFARPYAEARTSRHPEALAGFYAPGGSRAL